MNESRSGNSGSSPKVSAGRPYVRLYNVRGSACCPGSFCDWTHAARTITNVTMQTDLIVFLLSRLVAVMSDRRRLIKVCNHVVPVHPEPHVAFLAACCAGRR